MEVAKAQLNKLIAGVSAEEIKLAETVILNAQNSLDAAKQSLEDVKKDAEDDLNSSYEDALNTIEDSYIKAYNAQQTVKTIQITYFQGNDQFSLKVKDEKSKIDNEVSEIKLSRDSAKNNSTRDNIDNNLFAIKKSLDVMLASLTAIRQTCEDASYQNVSSTDKTSLDTQKLNISTAITNIVNSQQSISSTKITNTTNINTAQAKVTTAGGSLNEAQDKLLQLKAPARQEDVDLYTAKVKQAEAEVSLLKTQISEATIFSPTAGQITKIEKREGEAVQLTTTVVSLLPATPLQIETDIYEEDIIKVKVGNSVEIKLTAFPGRTLKGSVISIDPAEKLIEGVAYYEVTVDFKDIIKEIKPGMTADVSIITDSKENVLTVSVSAVEEKDGKKIVKVLTGKEIKEKEIETGLEGTNDLVEVISGLKEGEEVVIE